MSGERRRILELALETLVRQRIQIDDEIAELHRVLRKGARPQKVKAGAAPAKKAAGRKGSRFSRAERARRSERMKAYWENWRKEHGR